MIKGKELKDTILALELTNFCNCSCIMCTQSHANVSKGFMSTNTLDNILKNIASEDLFFDKLIPFGLGESTLHPQFSEFMGKIFSFNKTHRYFGSIDIHTNAIDLNEESIDLFIKYSDQISSISFSIDAATENTYFNIRKNRNFNNMIKNIKHFFVKRGREPKPRATLQFIVMPENKDECMDFLENWKNFFEKERIEYQVNHDWYPPMKKDTVFFKRLNPIKHEKLGEAEALHYSAVKELGLIKEKIESSKEKKEERAVVSNEFRGEKRRYPCSGPFKYVTVCWNGDVTVCCIDTLRDLKIGNVNEKGLFEIWMSRKNHDYRLAHIKGDLSSMKKCTMCNNLDSPDISREELENYLKKYGYNDYLKYLEEL